MPRQANAVAVAALLLVAGACSALGATVTVTIDADDIDIDQYNGTIADLPGPDGEVSLSEALIATNNTPGLDRIEFAIPMAPGQTLVTFHSITGYWWRANDSVDIDGSTQTDYAGDRNPDGWELSIWSEALGLNADNCTLTGFHDSDFGVSGANCLIEGNTGYGHISLFAGGGSTIRGNEGGTIKIDRSSNNIVVGNTVQRVRIWGFGVDNLATGNVVGGPNPEDRNRLTGYGTVNSEGLPAGATVELFDTDGTIIENNWIGTADGMTQGSQYSTMGIKFIGTNQGTVVRDNLISGILGHGQGPHHAGQLFGWAVYMEGSATDVSIVGNTFGLDLDGEPTLGAVYGINLATWNNSGINDIRIGGPQPGEGNVIAGQIFSGIVVGNNSPLPSAIRISGNEIRDNGQLGIDLYPGIGVTPNDPLDSDAGANGLQNFPVLVEAELGAGLLHVVGTLHSNPAGEFTVELFASPSCDASGHGEGAIFLGATFVATDAGGDGDFDLSIPAGTVQEGWSVTATATSEPLGNTSEFSACAVVEEVVTAALPPAAPAAARLGLPWPNPANPRVSVDLALPRDGHYRVRVLDASGRAVATLLDGQAGAGDLRLTWDGNEATGAAAASGLYLFELSGEGWDTRKFTLLR